MTTKEIKMKTLKITQTTHEALIKIQNDCVQDLHFKPTLDECIKGLIYMTITEGFGKEYQSAMENIKYEKQN